MEIYTCIGYKTLRLNSRPLAQKNCKTSSKSRIIKSKVSRSIQNIQLQSQIIILIIVF